MNFSNIRRKIKSVLKFIFKILSNKMFFLIPLGAFLFYRMKNLPLEIKTSDFLSIINIDHIKIITVKHCDFVDFTNDD